VITVFPRQGHYALDPKALASFPAADIEIDQIGELLNYDLHAFIPERSAEKEVRR
jgi:hypothetical protein